jgi:hypothetical protein
VRYAESIVIRSVASLDATGNVQTEAALDR